SIAMLPGRFIPVIAGLWIAGLLVQKYIPQDLQDIKNTNCYFWHISFTVIIIPNVRSLFPALIPGPVSDHFLLM
ncbi:MAG: potassium-transporting ATPase subunit KdpA, partial [Ginsengibacter sp.]